MDYPSPEELKKHQDRGRRGSSKGVYAAVADVLAKNPPLSIATIAKLAGFPEDKVRSCISAMMSSRGGVFKMGSRTSPTYTAWDSDYAKRARGEKMVLSEFAIPHPAPAPSTQNVAPLNRDPLEHMKLAMMTRR